MGSTMNAIIRWLALLPVVLLGKLAGVEAAIASMPEPEAIPTEVTMRQARLD